MTGVIYSILNLTMGSPTQAHIQECLACASPHDRVILFAEPGNYKAPHGVVLIPSEGEVSPGAALLLASSQIRCNAPVSPDDVFLYMDSSGFGPFRGLRELADWAPPPSEASASWLPSRPLDDVGGRSSDSAQAGILYLQLPGRVLLQDTLPAQVERDPWLVGLESYLASLGIALHRLDGSAEFLGPREGATGPGGPSVQPLWPGWPYFISKAFLSQDRVSQLNWTSHNETAETIRRVREEYPRWGRIIDEWCACNVPVGEVRENFSLSFMIQETAEVCNVSSGVFAHLYYEDQFEVNCSHLARLPSDVDLHVSVATPDAAGRLRGVLARMGYTPRSVSVAPSPGRDVAALLELFAPMMREYELACFIHDKKSAGSGPPVVGESFRRLLWENMIGGQGYVDGVRRVFQKEPSLGMLVPPVPLHADYGQLVGSGWTVNYGKTAELAALVGLRRRPDPDDRLFAFGTAFWCRPPALESLLSMQLPESFFPQEPIAVDGEVNHAVERILPFVVADAGYLVGVAYSQATALDRLGLYEGLLGRLTRRTVEDRGCTQLGSMVPPPARNRAAAVCQFAKNASRLVIYGQGLVARDVASILRCHGLDHEFSFVSEGYDPNRWFEGRPGYALGEVKGELAGAAVIVACAHKNRAGMIANLEKIGHTDFIVA